MADKEKNSPKKPWLAALLGLIFVGLGQFYLGKRRRGAWLLVMALIGFVLAGVQPLLVVWVTSPVLAFIDARGYNYNLKAAQGRASEPHAIPKPAAWHAPSAEPRIPPPPPRIPASPTRPTSTAYCAQCGQPIATGKKFCGACGVPFTQTGSVSTPTRCPRCQSPVALNAQFCGRCGSPVAGDR
jgi:TM2 domain-containing membrane protein YozV/DNA-directed RNA polymerase subunit RPC12/RpoP